MAVFHKILYIIILHSFFTLAYSQEKPASFTPKNLETFLDSLVPSLLKDQNTAGCGISVVKDDSIFLVKGFGYADLENKRRVDPGKTLFRTASVCKLIVASVLMHLKEKGLIDLNSDINKYLKKFKIKDKFSKPVTAANLLTHTAGFDDFNIGKSSRSEKEAVPLGEFLKNHLPERITPPGEVFSYSNMGMALAAFLVEEITGEDFEKYTVKNLFLPLEMYKSSFRTNEKYRNDIYKGYLLVNGEQTEVPFDFINDYPAGQMLTTMTEFSNFMIMHLNNGKFRKKQIIDSSLISEMQSARFTHHPELHSASGYGFGISDLYGRKVLSHYGGYPGILTSLLLFPELKLGIYIAVNGYNSSVNYIIADSVMKRFFPSVQNDADIKYPLTSLPHYYKDVDRFTGTYRFTRYSRNEFNKISVLAGLTSGEIPIWKNDKGMLMMYNYAGKVRRLIQVEPLLFRSVDDDYYLSFREDPEGNITHLFTDGVTSLEKTGYFYTIKFQRILFAFVTFIFALITLMALVLRLSGKIRTKKFSGEFRLVLRISNLYMIYLALLGLTIYFFLSPLELMSGFAYGMPWYFYLIQLIPVLFIILTGLLSFKIIAGIKTKKMRVLPGMYYSIFLLICFTAIWFMNTWNLVGFRF